MFDTIITFLRDDIENTINMFNIANISNILDVSEILNITYIENLFSISNMLNIFYCSLFVFSVFIVVVILTQKKQDPLMDNILKKKYKRAFILVLTDRNIIMTSRLKLPNCLMKKGENPVIASKRAFYEIYGFGLYDIHKIGYLSWGNNFVLVVKTKDIINDDYALKVISIDDIRMALEKQYNSLKIKNTNIFRKLDETTCNFTNFTFDTYAPNYCYINFQS